MVVTPDLNKAYDFSDDSIGKIYITGGGFVEREFQGVGSNSMFGWQELVWRKSPSRSAGSFAFTNMDNLEVGLIARCEIVIPYTNYEDYRAMRKILARERHFKVKFFDMDDAKWRERDMYWTEDSKSKFFLMQKHIVGVRDYSIKLVGTNLDLDVVVDEDGNEKYALPKYTISYHESSGTTKKVVVAGENEIIRSFTSDTVPEGKHFGGWIDKDGDTIVGYYSSNKQSVTVWKDLNLYPWWK